jgi:hypothetical protein
LIDTLKEVDSRLNVGLSQSELSDKIGDASVAYDDINAKALRGTCLSAGAKLETAFNNYVDTVSTWSDCIYDYGCDVDNDILSSMQAKWAVASRAVDRATTLLDSLNPDSPDFRPNGVSGKDA